MIEVFVNIALIALTIWGACSLARRVIKVESAEGLSLGMAFLTVLNCSAWVVYGAARHELVQILTGALATAAWTIVVVVAVVSDGYSWKRATCAFAACALVLASAQQLGGVAALGALATVCAIVSRVPQALESWRRPEGRGVSVAAFATNASTCLIWVVYGSLHDDIWVAASSLYLAAHSLFVVARTTRAREVLAVANEDFERVASPHAIQPRRIERPVEAVRPEEIVLRSAG